MNPVSHHLPQYYGQPNRLGIAWARRLHWKAIKEKAGGYLSQTRGHNRGQKRPVPASAAGERSDRNSFLHLTQLEISLAGTAANFSASKLCEFVGVLKIGNGPLKLRPFVIQLIQKLLHGGRHLFLPRWLGKSAQKSKPRIVHNPSPPMPTSDKFIAQKNRQNANDGNQKTIYNAAHLLSLPLKFAIRTGVGHSHVALPRIKKDDAAEVCAVAIMLPIVMRYRRTNQANIAGRAGFWTTHATPPCDVAPAISASVVRSIPRAEATSIIAGHARTGMLFRCRQPVTR